MPYSKRPTLDEPALMTPPGMSAQRQKQDLVRSVAVSGSAPDEWAGILWRARSRHCRRSVAGCRVAHRPGRIRVCRRPAGRQSARHLRCTGRGAQPGTPTTEPSRHYRRSAAGCHVGHRPGRIRVCKPADAPDAGAVPLRPCRRIALRVRERWRRTEMRGLSLRHLFLPASPPTHNDDEIGQD
jgi:hypothetical protein